jgi:hypothetical protein
MVTLLPINVCGGLTSVRSKWLLARKINLSLLYPLRLNKSQIVQVFN